MNETVAIQPEEPIVRSVLGAPAPMPEEVQPESLESRRSDEMLRADALARPSGWKLLPDRQTCPALKTKWNESTHWIQKAASELRDDVPGSHPLREQVIWIVENMRPLRVALRETAQSHKTAIELPQIRLQEGADQQRVPRAYAAAAGYLRAANFVFRPRTLALYFAALQQTEGFESAEIWGLRGMLQLVLLEEIGRAIRSLLAVVNAPGGGSGGADNLVQQLPTFLTCLRKISDADWKDLLEELSPTEAVLRQDPSGTYPRMDFESRNIYREAVLELSRASDASELAVARKAVDLARSAQREWSTDTRISERRSHVGYYLVEKGRKSLERRINYQPGLLQQVRRVMLDWPEVVYLVGIELLTLAAMAFVLSGLGVAVPLIPALLLLLLPATEAGVGVMNRLVSSLLKPRALPKLDFCEGIPADCTTVVGVPTLLMNEQQVRQIVRDLEIRYLANRSANLHFALLTDPPDSPHPHDGKENLVTLCSVLIEDLNRRYRGEGKGGFFHFHRHRVYNPAEGAWMGWERKRGKLLDFNNLLRQRYDSFPVKVGDLSVLPSVRYVITLDSDTELPRESAHRLIGALAHPLNRAVIDPVTNTVVEGYGILQPRVGISVRAASRSRLAAIYSGHTGFDIYTRAVSNVYQDLFGEGSFTGKGIYEVDVFQQVLAERFPLNSILSHDLIEGAYARAALVSEVEVIDDYPSHFSAYSRRKHRWVRGDWQIMRWLFPRVPGHEGHKVWNPLGVISRWKILDNLRRSVIEIATFVLLLAGWFFLPGGPVHWTVATLVLLLIPAYVQVALGLLNIRRVEHLKGFFKDTWEGFVAGQVDVFLFLAFLAHQTLLTLDAIVRTVVRLTVTHRRLLQWETAAQAELEVDKKTPVDIYLDLTPCVSLAIGLALAVWRPAALPVALPVLVLWACSKFLAKWLNRPLRAERTTITAEDEAFLRKAALETWRYFRVFSNAECNWLIPDHVLEDPPALAQQISPTNLGLLLNARLAAYDLGFLSLPEFVRQTESTLAATSRLPRSNGHFLNWCNSQTYEPIKPLFVSTVDSGNLVCCLWALKQGCLQMLTEPLIQSALWQGTRDHANLVAELAGQDAIAPEAKSAAQELKARMDALPEQPSSWIEAMPELHERLSRLAALVPTNGESKLGDLQWWVAESSLKLNHLGELVSNLAPWLLPEYQSLLIHPGLQMASDAVSSLTLEALPAFVVDLDRSLETLLSQESVDSEITPAATKLREALATAAAQSQNFAAKLKALGDEAGRLAWNTDFRFLYDPKRKVLSIGYDVEKQRVEEACYELLASEARIGAFAAIAKEDVPQESWFHLGRAHTLCEGERVLFSWSGTMFEYLMPALWMRFFPNTILDQSMRAAVECQRRAAEKLGVPWGISEAACSRRNEAGQYEYHAFGARGLALKPKMPEGLVISPYSSFLALAVDAAEAVKNLRALHSIGCSGRFGFYEAVEFKASEASGSPCPEIVRSWMVHHQGMSLLAISNLLSDSALQKRFHQEPLVAATERLLHERVPGTIPVDAEQPKSAEIAMGAAQPCRNELPAAQEH